MASGKLSALKVKALTTPGRYGDGGGLWLQVRDAQHRSWLFRYMRAGQARAMGLGSLDVMPLAEARHAAQEARKLLHQGIDPLEHRNAAKAAAAARAPGVTFRQVMERYLASHEAGWRNSKHSLQWRKTLEGACEVFGDQPVSAVDTGAVMQVLEPIWRTKTATASRLRGRIESVLDYATARGWRSGENPARWRGHLKNLLPPPNRVARVEHHAALPWSEIGAFVTELRRQESLTALALEFTILTAARRGETLGATWAEIDLDAAVWTVPAGRMKAGQEHRVPLSEPALAILRRLQAGRDALGAYVFPGLKRGRPLSEKAIFQLLLRMGRTGVTVHGFRSTFRDWCAEETTYPREVAEMALAHAIPDAVEAAYRRGDLFEKRRELMREWAGVCGRGTSELRSAGTSASVA